MKTENAEFKKGDLLAQIEDPFHYHWRVMDSDGFFYLLNRKRCNGVGEVEVGVPKRVVDSRYVRIDDD